MPYPRGKVLGGCSSINGMIYMRGQARDYDGWARETGDSDWRWENVIPAFKAHEDHHRLDGGADPVTGSNSRFSDMHGHGGEWRIEKQRLRWDILDAIAEATAQTGVPRTDDFNNGDNEGVGYFEVNQRSGWRWNTARAFLRPAMGRANLAVWTRAHVEALTFASTGDGRHRCTGLAVRRDSARVVVEARREVVLAAGAIGSPQILQLSGVGPAALMKSRGIDVILDLPGVGENLQDHLQIRAVFKIESGKTLNTLASSFMGKAAIALEYGLKRTGPMSMGPSQLGAFTRSDPDRPYASTEGDRRVAADSLRQVRRIVAQPALAPYRPAEWKPGVQFQTDEELARLAGDIANTIFHPVGTTKMGRIEDPMTVVDSRLRVYGITGLRIADAGVMPTITSGNTNSPTLMIAEKAAGWILAGG
jgi:choline dehydrogenase